MRGRYLQFFAVDDVFDTVDSFEPFDIVDRLNPATDSDWVDLVASAMPSDDDLDSVDDFGISDEVDAVDLVVPMRSSVPSPDSV